VEITTKATGLSKEKVEELFESEILLTTEEAKELHIIDQVLKQPS
jgi:ATP-dependent protease ClpP protease subunit